MNDRTPHEQLAAIQPQDQAIGSGPVIELEVAPDFMRMPGVEGPGFQPVAPLLSPDTAARPALALADLGAARGILLSDVLQRDRNNLDIVRLIAACMVIYGHANAIVPAPLAGGDIVAAWLRFDYSGSVAVKMFFFLSGLVVTNSLLSKQCLMQFTLARIWRIWPALIAVVLVSVCVIGPWVTTLNAADYWCSAETRDYLFKTLGMHIQFTLPGAFEGQATNAVNGSLWSLPHEVGAYVLLVAAFALGLHRKPLLAIGVTALIFIDPLLPQRLLFSWRQPDTGVDSLAPCFAIGALMAMFKHRIRVDWMPVLGLGILFLSFRQTPYAAYLFYGALFFAILYICSRPWMVRWRFAADISYGVYIWGWPVQQMLAHAFPQMDVNTHRVVAIALSCALGALSWYLLEKPCIAIGQRMYAQWQRARAAWPAR